MTAISINEELQSGLYHVKRVAALVGVSPMTLRAWERRYGLPTPRRGEQGYRLYSEYDLRALRWLKAQMQSGLSISRAAQAFQSLRAAGRDPALDPGATEPVPNGHARTGDAQLVGTEPFDLARLTAECAAGCRELDEVAVVDTLRRALALYPYERVLLDVVSPVMVLLGDAWHRGELPTAVEHFATQVMLRQLWSLHAAAPAPWRAGTLVAACAPTERHELGLLMLVVRLRWRGWDVKYLGPDLGLHRLEEVLALWKPRLLLFSATRPEAVAALDELPGLLDALPIAAPRIIVGGQGVRDNAGGVPWASAVIAPDEADAVGIIEHVLKSASVSVFSGL